jgi:hypothetical protein
MCLFACCFCFVWCIIKTLFFLKKIHTLFVLLLTMLFLVLFLSHCSFDVVAFALLHTCCVVAPFALIFFMCCRSSCIYYFSHVATPFALLFFPCCCYSCCFSQVATHAMFLLPDSSHATFLTSLFSHHFSSVGPLGLLLLWCSLRTAPLMM